MVIELPVAVNGPSVAGDEGTFSGTPELGMGFGYVMLMASPWSGIVAGVAPVASSCVFAVPDNVGAMAAAAEAKEAGRFTLV